MTKTAEISITALRHHAWKVPRMSIRDLHIVLDSKTDISIVTPTR
ncbi:hypothetical protein O9X99_22345 [Agrobacterium salinitolerans]|uniref:Uncharacterized protein n=1 Tax=Agrobacterium salinitolerans TaxID=1183413 RepID=A0A9X3R244_9HYPH|nr:MULTISPECIES: hypothetical protein [Agrobacterium]MCZ7852673.1 hypothetical protein [Agrobacterium salinitolerans]MCZ7894412.1 hypothetical protein [Agrobacterium salinitolerans]MCZ7940404.1 hypothetical protein [Agrobacterium salinitolerans]MCZ7977464.1 hypothetical protein [Agrobacterium salinitolerans]